MRVNARPEGEQRGGDAAAPEHVRAGGSIQATHWEGSVGRTLPAGPALPHRRAPSFGAAGLCARLPPLPGPPREAGEVYVRYRIWPGRFLKNLVDADDRVGPGAVPAGAPGPGCVMICGGNGMDAAVVPALRREAALAAQGREYERAKALLEEDHQILPIPIARFDDARRCVEVLGSWGSLELLGRFFGRDFIRPLHLDQGLLALRAHAAAWMVEDMEGTLWPNAQISAAETYANRLLTAARLCLAGPPVDVPSTLPKGSYADVGTLLQACLVGRPGLLLGENHRHGTTRALIRDHLPVLWAGGLRTLILEHFPFGPLSAPTVYRMAASLDAYFELDAVSGYEALVRAAVAAGLDVHGLESDASLASDSARLALMNCEAARAIAAVEARGSARWLALVGNAHLYSVADVKGLHELTANPAFCVDPARVSARSALSRVTGAHYDRAQNHFINELGLESRSDRSERWRLRVGEGPDYRLASR